MDLVQELVDLLKEKKREDKPSVLLWALGIVAAICAIAAVAYAVYRFFTPDYLKDFDDEDFEDDFDAYFEDEDIRLVPDGGVKEKLEEVKDAVSEKAEEAAEKVEEIKDAVSEKRKKSRKRFPIKWKKLRIKSKPSKKTLPKQ